MVAMWEEDTDSVFYLQFILASLLACWVYYLIHNRWMFFLLTLDVQNLLTDLEADEAHDTSHALQVVKHGEKALNSLGIHDSNIRLQVRLACLLHDVDDRKIVGNKNSSYCENAKMLLLKWFPEHLNETLEMIELVSCSKNGNEMDPNLPKWKYIPRHADRLEAMGEIGIDRCYVYTLHVNRALFTEETPRATTEEELDLIATKERFTGYLSGVKSDSMIDHFYDKLLHLKTPTGISYIDKEMERRHKVMVDFVLEFGKTGEVPL
jgi:uncharacterized protein